MTASILLTTCFWGAWHSDLLERIMLPTLLSARNLPELARRLDVRYRIGTTPADRQRLMATPIFRTLADTLPIDWVTEQEHPDITYHVAWYHQAIATARATGS